MGEGWVCARCEAANSGGTRFCGQCGAPLAPEPVTPAPPPSREERRQITVLFSDASGYTTMAEQLDPEVVREVMGKIYSTADAIASRFGGRVDKRMGDAVLMVFGDPLTHEDDAERAVRAALELHAAIDAMRSELQAMTGSSFEMHSGINSGVVVTGDLDGDRASGPLGDMVNVAARLQARAGSGEVLVGPETFELVQGRFAFSDLGDYELKGRSRPVRARRVEGFATEGRRPSRRIATFIGRHEELGVLLGAVDRLRDGQSSVITVCAEAGAGKTRLLEEVRTKLGPDVVWLEGRAYPYTADIPYSPVIDLLNSAARVDEGDSAAEVRRKLAAMVEAALPGDESVMPVLVHLYGSSGGESSIDLEAFRSSLVKALAALIGAVAQRSPTVVCLQDLHWVDPSTTELVRQLTSTVTTPFVMICNFRPGYSLGVRTERVLQLTELSARQTREQLQSLLETIELPGGLLDAITARTEGNPFFVEEIVNSLIETDTLVRGDDGWVLRRTLDELALPSTIRGVIAARIDGLDATRRRVLREVSVVGREFLYRLVRTVSTAPDDLDLSLEALAAADLIREKSSDPELEYVFKHGLTQEVAYEGLLRRDRQRLHESVGRAIESHLGDRVEEFIETLAYHFQRSGLVVEAVGYLRRAGRRALERYSMIECHNHYEAAYQVLTHDDPDNPVDAELRRRLLLETILEWATAHYYSGQYGHLHDLFTAHQTLAAEVGDDALRARWLAWRGNIVWSHDYDIIGAIPLLEEALTLGRSCADTTAQGFALAWLSWSLTSGGQPKRAAALWPDIEALLPSIPDPTDRRYVHIKGLSGCAQATAITGRTVDARAMAQELLDIGQRTGNRRASAMGHLVRITIYQVVGDSEMVGREAHDVVACQADPIYVWLGEVFIVSAALQNIRLAEARYLVAEYRAEPERHRFGTLVAAYDMTAAMVAAIDGHIVRGLRELTEIRDRMATAGDVFQTMGVDLFMARALVRLATGDLPMSKVKNPGLLLMLPGAPKRARAMLDSLMSRAEEHGYDGVRAALEYEFALLAKHQRRSKEARAHLDSVDHLLSAEPYAYLRHEAQKTLAEL
jgi:class 3 adenylate cyclase